MSTRDALIEELMKQPEHVLVEVRHYLNSLDKSVIHNGHEEEPPTKRWPEKYFERTAGAFAAEPFERPPQLPFEKREDW